MKKPHMTFVFLFIMTILLLIGWACLKKSQIPRPDTNVKEQAQPIIRNAPLAGMTNQPNTLGIRVPEQTKNESISNSIIPNTVASLGSNRESGLSDDEAHRIALDAIKEAAGISNICSYSVHMEERNRRSFQVVTFLGAPFSDSKIDNYIYKVGINPTNGQVLFIRRPAD